jgi:hypothetical protein
MAFHKCEVSCIGRTIESVQFIKIYEIQRSNVILEGGRFSNNLIWLNLQYLAKCFTSKELTKQLEQKYDFYLF